jgi:hypothetical protein
MMRCLGVLERLCDVKNYGFCTAEPDRRTNVSDEANREKGSISGGFF